MKKIKNPYILISTAFLFCFNLLLILLMIVDTSKSGLQGSEIGFSSLNNAVKSAISPNHAFYVITEILGYIAIALMGVFAVVGIIQLLKRKHLHLVDKRILGLAGVYILVAFCYVLFEIFPVNYRPIGDTLEASFPSSHTFLFLTVLSTSLMAIWKDLNNKKLRIALAIISSVLMVIMVVFRLLSGVHWFTDIIGGILLSGVISFGYLAFLHSACAQKS